MIIDGSISLLILNQLIIEILQILKVRNRDLLVVLSVLLCLLKFVALDLKYFEIVLQTIEILNCVIKTVELIISDRENI